MTILAMAMIPIPPRGPMPAISLHSGHDKRVSKKRTVKPRTRHTSVPSSSPPQHHFPLDAHSCPALFRDVHNLSLATIAEENEETENYRGTNACPVAQCKYSHLPAMDNGHFSKSTEKYSCCRDDPSGLRSRKSCNSPQATDVGSDVDKDPAVSSGSGWAECCMPLVTRKRFRNFIRGKGAKSPKLDKS